MYTKIKNFEAYSSNVGESFPKLCPRLVPFPLWGLSLADLAKMEPRVASVVSERYPALVERFGKYWMSLDRSGKCEACGGEGKEIDEEWLYFVFNKRGKPVEIIPLETETFPPPEPEDLYKIIMRRKSYRGVAYLENLKLLCSKCYFAKRFFGDFEWLRIVNGIGSADEKKYDIVQLEVHDIQSQLSDIEKWRIRIGRLPGLDDETRKGVEKLLNDMYRSELMIMGSYLCYFSRADWLYPSSGAESKAKRLSRREVYAVVAKVDEKVRRRRYKHKKKLWTEFLTEMVKNRLKAEGIHVLDDEFTLFVRLLLDKIEKPEDWEVSAALEGEPDLERFFEALLVLKSRGKWMVNVPNPLYEKVFRKMLESLKRAGLAHQACILCKKGKLVKNELPIYVYAPSSLAPSYISSVAKVLKTVLNRFGLTGTMYYEPDIFSDEDVRSEKGRKASIYEYSY